MQRDQKTKRGIVGGGGLKRKGQGDQKIRRPNDKETKR